MAYDERTRMQPYPPTRRNFLAAAAAGLAAHPTSGQTQDLPSCTLKKAAELLRSRAASPSDLVQACLKRIEGYDSKLHSFITVTGEQALKTAREMEAEQRRGKWRSP